MSAAYDLLADCPAMGIRLIPVGTRGLAVDAPSGVLTPELMEQLKVHKPELVMILVSLLDITAIHSTDDVAAAPSIDVADDPFGDWIELHRPDGGLSWLHPDHAGNELELIDPPGPCPKCGRLELWESAATDLFRLTPSSWRCVRCDPPRQLRQTRRMPQRHDDRDANQQNQRSNATQ